MNESTEKFKYYEVQVEIYKTYVVKVLVGDSEDQAYEAVQDYSSVLPDTMEATLIDNDNLESAIRHADHYVDWSK